MIHSFPKIFTIGQDFIKDIFNNEVEITEKIDGSQFSFGKINNQFYMRSKGAQLFPESYAKMFSKAVEYVLSIEHILPDNTVFYCEYLEKPKHNILVYDRIPKNNLMLYGVCDNTLKFVNEYEKLIEHADFLNIEVVPLIYKGIVENVDFIKEIMERKSVLGNVQIEGIVVKNYKNPFLLGSQPIPLMMGKYVSEKFKEKHNKDWKKEKTTKGKWETFKDGFRTEARWNKSIQHLREKDELTNSPKDIGKLIKEIQNDITEEEKENIKNFLWKLYGKEILRNATKGFPEYYKEYLLKRNFE